MADDILRKASQKLGELVSENEAERKKPEQDRRDFISSLAREIGQVVVKGLSPLVAGLTMQSKKDREDMMRAIASIDVKVPPIPSPKVNIPQINVPTPKVTVNPPQVKVPQINVPKTEIKMPDIMDVKIQGVNNKAPMPVIMMDTKGKPMPFSMGTGGGGRSDFLKIKDILTSTGASLINDAGELKTAASVSASISQDYGSGEIGSETVRMVMATDAIASVNIVSGSSSGTEYTDGDVDSTPSGTAQFFLNDVGEVMNVVSSTNALPVNVSDFTSTIVTQISDGDGNYRDTFPVEGTVSVDSVTNSVATYQLDGDGNYKDVTMVDAISSVAAVLQDADGNYRDSFPITGTVTGITNSIAVYNLDGDGNYKDATPVEATDFDIRNLTTANDEVVSRPIRVRGGLSTAYVTITDSSEDTLISASSGNYLDLVWITAANQSDAAVTVDLRDVSGGNVVASFEVPANSTSGIAPAVPYPQGNIGNAWTVQNADSDISNTTVDITALFSQET